MNSSHGIYKSFESLRKNGRKAFGLLIDPDNAEPSAILEIKRLAVEAKVDFFFVGGSLVVSTKLDDTIRILKQDCNIPVVLFPGSPSQISKNADGLLYLSLISGRNADLLIGQHVISAPAVKKSGLEIISTGYMVVDGGVPTTVSYISNALPLPWNKPDIAACTAMAGEMLGLKTLYLDCGSGAHRPVSTLMIKAVASETSIPLIVGGGITSPEAAYDACSAGADIIVVGNAIEKDTSLIKEMAYAVKKVSIIQ